MNKIFTLISLLYTVNIYSQTADTNTHNAMNDSIVARFNRKDYKSVYELAGDNFKKYSSEKSFIDFLTSINGIGAILKTELIEDIGDFKYYKWICEKHKLQLTLNVQKDGKFKVFGLSDFVPVVNPSTIIFSDNPLKSPQDMDVDKAIKKYYLNTKTASISMVIIKNKMTYFYNYSNSNKNVKVAADKNTFYEIGSLTKTFTGILLAQAVIDKKIKLDDDIRKYLDGSYPNLEYEGNPIRIIHLANHTARIAGKPGIPENFKKQVPYDSLNPYRNYTMEMFWEALHTMSIDTIPGIQYDYSNMGAALLGHILAKAYHMSYLQLVEKYITKPLGMNDTKMTLSAKQMKRFPKGFDEQGNETSYWDLLSFTAAGALRSTTYDMAKYLKANLEAKTSAIKLSQKTTFISNDNTVGMYWGIGKTLNEEVTIGHNGGTGGYKSKIQMLPSHGIGLVILSNSSVDITEMGYELQLRLSK